MISLYKKVLLFSAFTAAFCTFAKNAENVWTPEQSQKYEQHFIQPQNPLGFPEYLQTVTVTYASQEIADRAKISFAQMPDGESIAFTTRWDDVNDRHLKMAQLLRKHNMKGTFFLTRPQTDYYRKIAIKLLQNGCAIGSHTLDHPLLPNLNPNGIFNQMMRMRPELESNLDTCVVSFVLPNCALNSPIENQTGKILGGIIQRCGYLSNPEYWNNNEKRYGLTPETCFATCLFSANDRNPTMEQFEKELRKQLDKIKKNPAVPRVTFGLHTWQNDKGFEELDRIFTKYGHNPDWWYCTENEYAAYRYQFLNTKIEKTERNGATVRYTLKRIVPSPLGSVIPLTLKFSDPPRSATATGQPIQPTPKGFYKLPHDASKQLPQYVDLIKNPENQPLTADIFESKKYPGISVGLHWNEKKQQLQAFILNRSRFPLEDITKTIYFPMQWKTPFRFQKTWQIPAGGKDSFIFTPPDAEENNIPEAKDGCAFYLLQCDFLLDGKAQRIYAAVQVKKPHTPTPCPRDTAVFTGPLANEKVTPSLLASLSVPGKILNNLGNSTMEKWRKQAFQPDNKSYVVSPFLTDYQWLTDVYPVFQKKKGVFLIVMDFNSPAEGSACKLFCTARDFTDIWLNGKKLPSFKNGLNLSAKKGLNRILFVKKIPDRARTSTLLTVAPEDPFFPVKCIQPDIEK